jgi:hypothetical protein
MDDVDFTVLAATSVLGDLIEKCPPAEACRDAFARMSKATISMCMKTTGFGTQAMRFLPRRQPESSNVSFFDPAQGQVSRPATHDAGYGTQQSGQRRPLPQFDMDLKNLFSADDLALRQPSSNRTQQSQTNVFSNVPIKSEHQAGRMSSNHQQPRPSFRQNRSTSQYQQNQTIDPQLQMSSPASTTSSYQAQQQMHQALSDQISDQLTNIPDYQSQQQQITNYPINNFSTESQSSFDFLQDDSKQGFNLQPGSDFGMGANTSDNTTITGDVADWDLAFGAGGFAFDGGAGGAWDESGGFDLFDGFFFGGGGTGMGGNGNGNGDGGVT